MTPDDAASLATMGPLLAGIAGTLGTGPHASIVKDRTTEDCPNGAFPGRMMCLDCSETDTPTTRSNPAWHRGYDEGAASAGQEVAVCAPPEEYDGEAATEFMAGFWTGLKHAREALK